ncbi:hypothetical protein C8R44DRAFT_178254 [Mycena epipterygia]|nr:hypothetical protein C8R44DRAFT_178254 [Mycena epipterygia]
MSVPAVRDAKAAAQQRSIAGRIMVRHSHHKRVLLRLTVYARDDNISPGLPFELVHRACFIIANNKDGTLEQVHANVDGAEVRYTEVVLNQNDLLKPGNYRYCVPGTSNYEICTSFRFWTPPKMPPTHWRQVDGVGAPVTRVENESSATCNAKNQDASCAVTGATDRLYASHLVPKGEEDWWMTHEMYLHSDIVSNITATIGSNLITLRSDLNELGFDEAHFFLYPYGGNGSHSS